MTDSTKTHDGALVVIVASRGRPQNAEALARAASRTTERDDTRFVLALDLDDPALPQYAQVVHRWSSLMTCIVSERTEMRQSGAINAAAQVILNSPRPVSFVGSMNDDHSPRTSGWDSRIREALSFTDGRPAFAYGDDRIHGANLPTAVFMTANVPRTLGYVCAPGMSHMYVDNVWMDWAKAIGEYQYLAHVIIEHMHPIAGKAEWDSLYAESNHPDVYAADWDAYLKYIAKIGDGGFRNDIEKLRALRSRTVPTA